MEGFAALQMENNHVKWKAMFDLEKEKQKASKKSIKICKSKSIY